MILSLSGSKRKEMFTLLFCKGYEADNVILLTLCPQPVRGSVCLYGWVYFCSLCKCVLPSDAYILMLFKSLFRGGKLQIPSLWNDTFFARATYYNLP